jgi:hypothetical protein
MDMANITVKFEHDDVEWLGKIFNLLNQEISSIVDRINNGYFLDDEGVAHALLLSHSIQLNETTS